MTQIEETRALVALAFLAIPWGCMFILTGRRLVDVPACHLGRFCAFIAPVLCGLIVGDVL